jgi:hypothetical protein
MIEFFLDQGHELDEVQPEVSGELVDSAEGGTIDGPLELADVSPVEANLEGERLLGDSLLLPETDQCLRERLVNHASSVARRRLSLYRVYY